MSALCESLPATLELLAIAALSVSFVCFFGRLGLISPSRVWLQFLVRWASGGGTVALFILVLVLTLLHADALFEECEDSLGPVFLALAFAANSLLFLLGALIIPDQSLKRYLAQLAAIEGDLPTRLRDGDVKLLRTSWLLEQPDSYVLQRQQDLPPEAFVNPMEAVRLLRESRVAALSYRWLDKDHPDTFGGTSGFHLQRVRRFLSAPAAGRPWCVLVHWLTRGRVCKGRVIEALMWDYASLAQSPRTPELDAAFRRGLGVMNSIYAHPLILVVQQTRLPDGFALSVRPHAVAETYDGSGWCFFEQSVASLMTEGGGHVVELDVGRVAAQADKLPPLAEVEARFHDERRLVFTGKADRSKCFEMYKELREKLSRFDEEKRPWLLRIMDEQLTSMGQERDRLVFLFAAFGFGLGLVVSIIWAAVADLRYGMSFVILAAVWAMTLLSTRFLFITFVSGLIAHSIYTIVLLALGNIVMGMFSLVFVVICATLLLPSRILRAHVAHFASLVIPSFGHAASGDAREYVWNSVCHPPFFRPALLPPSRHVSRKRGGGRHCDVEMAASPSVGSTAARPVHRPGRPLLDDDAAVTVDRV